MKSREWIATEIALKVAAKNRQFSSDEARDLIDIMSDKILRNELSLLQTSSPRYFPSTAQVAMPEQKEDQVKFEVPCYLRFPQLMFDIIFYQMCRPRKKENDNNWSFDFDEVTSWKKPPTCLVVSISAFQSSCCLIVRASVVLTTLGTVVGSSDWRFDKLSRSHNQTVQWRAVANRLF